MLIELFIITCLFFLFDNFLHWLSDCFFFSRLHSPDAALVALQPTGMAAWRSGGIPPLPFKSALPAAVAPNRLLSAGILPRFCPFHYFVGLYSIVVIVLNSTTLSAYTTLSVLYLIPLLCRLALHCRYGTQFKSLVNAFPQFDFSILLL